MKTRGGDLSQICSQRDAGQTRAEANLAYLSSRDSEKSLSRARLYSFLSSVTVMGPARLVTALGWEERRLGRDD